MEERDDVDNIEFGQDLILSDEIFRDAAEITADYLARHKQTVATMESITSGIVATLLTAPSGASAYVKYGWITYSNEAKLAAGVDAHTIGTYGVYSPQCAREMAERARSRASATYGIGVTGVAGPGSHEGVPAGSVWFSICDDKGKRQTTKIVFPGNRIEVRMLAGKAAIVLFAKFLLDTQEEKG